MKVNFATIRIKDIEGNEQIADFQKQIGNQLYMTGQDIEECELGKRIYFAEGEVELTADECTIVRRVTAGYSYVARIAIDAAMKQ
jgi:hypothetical protein